MTSADKILARRPLAPNSVSLAKWDGEVVAGLAAASAAIAALKEQFGHLLGSGSFAAIARIETQLAEATLDQTRLQMMHDAAAAQIPKTQAAETQEAASLSAAREEAIIKRTTLLRNVNETYTQHAAALAVLAQEERAAHEVALRFYGLHVRAHELARAAVSVILPPVAFFAPGSGANTIAECLVRLPALADPDTPEAPRPAFWPPPPPPSPPPPPPRPAPGPSTTPTRVVTYEYRHPPGPFDPSEHDLMPYRPSTAN